jgi:hypothetical protein
MHKNYLVLQNGRCIAAKIAGRLEFLAAVDPADQLLIRKSLQVGRKIHRAPAAAVTDIIPEPHFIEKKARPRPADDRQLNSRRRFGY